MALVEEDIDKMKEAWAIARISYILLQYSHTLWQNKKLSIVHAELSGSHPNTVIQ